MKMVRWVCTACRRPGFYYGIALPAGSKHPVCPNEDPEGKKHLMLAYVPPGVKA